MPVDRWNMHGDKRQNNPQFSQNLKQKGLARAIQVKGGIRLSSPPRERTAADAMRMALETATVEGLTRSESMYLVEERYKALAAALEAHTQAVGRQRQGQGAPSSLSNGSSSVVAIGVSDDRGSEVAPRALRVWDLLEKTTMDSPAHGVLSLRGKALVESTLLNAMYDLYPRMRSKHAQVLIHQCCGLLSTSRVAGRLGLVSVFNIHAECGLWRELNTLKERFRIARQMSTIHKDRTAAGLMAQRRWYWRSVLKVTARKLAKFPVTAEDLTPRLEWLRHQVFQWIATVEELEGSAVARTLIFRLFCSSLGRKWHVEQLERQAEQCLEASANLDGAAVVATQEKLRTALAAVAPGPDGRRPFRDAIDDNEYHPLNNRALARQEQMHSSFGAPSTQPLVDDVQSARWSSVEHLAPPQIVDLVDPSNAFREIQLILKYDPFVSNELKGAPIDVDITVGAAVSVEETNSYTQHAHYQQFRQVEFKEVKLFAGHHCIGVGKGATEQLAIQEASVHALLNYYLRQGPAFEVEEGAPINRAMAAVDDTPTTPSAPSYAVSSEEAGALGGAQLTDDMLDIMMGGGADDSNPIITPGSNADADGSATFFF